MKKSILTLVLMTCTVLATFAQSRIDSVALRAMQVGRVMQQERVYLHFDNTAYYLGETIWFKAYTTFGTDDRPSTLSKVLYVELVAPEGYIVKTKKYKLDEKGSCYGEFELNPLYLSGYYEIRAYTRYMLNWGKDAVFSRVFPVFDKVNADNWDFKNMLDRRRGFSERGEWVSAELPEATLDFFPESGHLVAGIESKVAYELRENDGLFSEEKITIFENNAPLLETVPSHMGKGSFAFTPKKGAKYRAEAVIKNKDGKSKKQTFKLPEIAEEGVVMSVAENGDSISITIRNNIAEDTEMGFAILYRGTMGYYKKLNTSYKETSFTIARNSLPEGVNRAVLFAGEKIPLAERQFFIMHDELQKGGRETIKLNVTANGYHTHNLNAKANEKITLKISRDDGKPIPDGSDLSLNVGDATGTQATSYSYNMYSYLLLGSELKGYIPDAAQYFDTDNSKRKEQLDLIMLTHGWTSYDWHLLARKEITDMQPIERGITIKGVFLQKNRNKELGERGRSIIVPQKYNLTRVDIATDGRNITTTTFRTDSTGAFYIELDDFIGTRIAALHPQTTFKHSLNISYQFALDRYFSPGYRLYDYWERNLGTPMSKNEHDSLVKINPFEYMLSSVDVVAKKKEEIHSRPPHSEVRFNYLDEWEYAQDVTYLDRFYTFEDRIYLDALDNIHTLEETPKELWEETGTTAKVREGNMDYEIGELEAVKSDEIISVRIPKSKETPEVIKYVGSIRYSNEDPITLNIDHEFDHTLTANDVVLSAMRRHNYNWAYWVQLMVVLGEYSHERVPQPDKEYLRGVSDVGKMTDFKEIVIRSDEKTRMQFENRDTHWTPLGRMMDNKVPVQKFYKGFLSQSYLYSGEGIDNCPDSHMFHDRIKPQFGINYPINPNYVACLIPYTEKERAEEIVPEFAAAGSSLRYTSVQGYSESKQFYSPDYSKIKPDGKDYRRTLLWIPEVTVTNGEAIVELYNSSNCHNIYVTVAGRDGRSLYSNDNITVTRTHSEEVKREKADNANTVDNDKSDESPEPMDPDTEAACAREHEKGVIYFNQRRYKDAITIFAELIQYKYPPAMYYVGMCYRDGKGMKMNSKMAIEFYTKAAMSGYAPAMYELAAMIDTRDGGNSKAAHDWYAKAADNNEPRALLEMSHRYNEGKVVEKDPGKAEELLAKAASLKENNAMFEYGVLLIAQSKDGIGYIKSAADNKHNAAMIYIMEYEHNAGNYKEAYKYAKQLSMEGDHRGTKQMADYYYEGKGVSRDKSLAKDLYREAANAGNEEAKEILKRL